ncbi:uncharacterized protein PHA67_011162 [Liasis olivaceus]
MADTVTEHGNVKIITQVIPQTGSLSTQAAAVRVVESTSGASQFISTLNKNTKNTLFKVLGVIQILWGITEVSFGITLTIIQRTLSITVQSGVYLWIGILLLISGSLLVEIEKRQPVWLVKAAFFANLLVCVAGLVAVILHATEIAQTVKEGSPCPANITEPQYCKNHVQILKNGLNSVFIIFLLLEISLAITALVMFKSQKQQDYQQMVS